MPAHFDNAHYREDGVYLRIEDIETALARNRSGANVSEKTQEAD